MLRLFSKYSMDYSQIKARFTKTLNRRDCTPTQIAEWIDDSIMKAQRLLTVPASEAVEEITVSAGFDRLFLPSDFLRLISISVDGVELTRSTLTAVQAMAQTTGLPTHFYRDDAALVLGPKPQPGSVIRLIYLSDFPALVNDGDKNFLSIIAADLLVAGAMKEACDFYSDPRGDAYDQKFITGITDLNLMAKRDDLMNASIAPGFGYGDF